MTTPSGPPSTGTAARFTGWHMFAILFAFFGVVFVVNFMMANFAISTFTGEVVDNGYVASQHFNAWLAEAAREKALGWSATAMRRPDGRVTVLARGPGTASGQLSALVWRTLGEGSIRPKSLAFDRDASGSFTSREALPEGRWQMRLTLTANGRVWHAMETV